MSKMLAATSRNSFKRVFREAALWSSQSECTRVLPVTFFRESIRPLVDKRGFEPHVGCQSTQQVAAKSAPHSSSSTIRNKPWSFVPDHSFQGTASGSAIARYQFRSTGFANSKNTIQVLRMCKEMKKEGVKPDIIIYNNLLACLAEDCHVLEAWAVVEDMSSMGIAPDRNTFHHLIHVRFCFFGHCTLPYRFTMEPRHHVNCSPQLYGISSTRWRLKISVPTNKHSC
jgi:pentatricopeptide repeat protein